MPGRVASVDWRPPGAMFAVLTVATCSAIPSTWHTLVPAGLTAVGASLVAVLIGAVEARVGSGAHPGVAPGRSSWARPTVTNVVRCVLAVLVVGALATSTGTVSYTHLTLPTIYSV